MAAVHWQRVGSASTHIALLHQMAAVSYTSNVDVCHASSVPRADVSVKGGRAGEHAQLASGKGRGDLLRDSGQRQSPCHSGRLHEFAQGAESNMNTGHATMCRSMLLTAFVCGSGGMPCHAGIRRVHGTENCRIPAPAARTCHNTTARSRGTCHSHGGRTGTAPRQSNVRRGTARHGRRHRKGTFGKGGTVHISYREARDGTVAST